MAQAVMREGVICHVEIPTKDVERTRAFYGNVFGWTFQSMPEMNYTLFMTREGGIGGGFFTPDEGMEPRVINYILVTEVEPFIDKIQSAGGQLVRGKTEVPMAGWFALVTDPDGNLFGLWKSAHPLPEPEPEKPAAAARPKPAKRKAKPAPRKAAPKAAKKAAKKPAKKAAKPAKKAAKKAAKKPAKKPAPKKAARKAKGKRR